MNSLMDTITPGEIAAGALERRLERAENYIKQMMVLINRLEGRLKPLEDYHRKFKRG